MFFNFVRHDLQYGIVQQKGRMLVTFLMFFCLSSYHFLTLRIFALTNPQYFETPVTTGDYFLALIGGCGKVETLSGGDTTFVMPAMWMVFVLWMMFTSLYYPFTDLHGIGKHIMAISGKREIWWLSKCVWAAANTTVTYLLIFAASFLSGICFGAKPSMEANWYLARELNMRTDNLTTTAVWNIWPVFLLTGFALVALSLIQLALSAAVKPLFSYLFLAAYLFAGAYVQSPVFFGNYTMGARSGLLVTTGLEPGLGAMTGVLALVLSVAIGCILFRQKDVLGGD